MSRLLEEKLKDSSTVSFFDLVPDHPDRYDMILSFSSLLEMMTTQGYDARQSELFGEILVEKGPDFGKKQRETEDSENTDQEQIELSDTAIKLGPWKGVILRYDGLKWVQIQYKDSTILQTVYNDLQIDYSRIAFDTTEIVVPT